MHHLEVAWAEGMSPSLKGSGHASQRWAMRHCVGTQRPHNPRSPGQSGHPAHMSILLSCAAKSILFLKDPHGLLICKSLQFLALFTCKQVNIPRVTMNIATCLIQLSLSGTSVHASACLKGSMKWFLDFSGLLYKTSD